MPLILIFIYTPLELNFAFSAYGVGDRSQNDTNLPKPREIIIPKIRIKVLSCENQKPNKNQEVNKSRSKKEKISSILQN